MIKKFVYKKINEFSTIYFGGMGENILESLYMKKSKKIIPKMKKDGIIRYVFYVYKLFEGIDVAFLSEKVLKACDFYVYKLSVN